LLTAFVGTNSLRGSKGIYTVAIDEKTADMEIVSNICHSDILQRTFFDVINSLCDVKILVGFHGGVGSMKLSGQGYFYMNNRKYTLKAGQCFFIPPVTSSLVWRFMTCLFFMRVFCLSIYGYYK